MTEWTVAETFMAAWRHGTTYQNMMRRTKERIPERNVCLSWFARHSWLATVGNGYTAVFRVFSLVSCSVCRTISCWTRAHAFGVFRCLLLLLQIVGHSEKWNSIFLSELPMIYYLFLTLSSCCFFIWWVRFLCHFLLVCCRSSNSVRLIIRFFGT